MLIKRLLKIKNITLSLYNMENKTIDRKKVLKSVIKILDDKQIVRSFLKGEASIQQLDKKGIKFAKPL